MVSNQNFKVLFVLQKVVTVDNINVTLQRLLVLLVLLMMLLLLLLDQVMLLVVLKAAISLQLKSRIRLCTRSAQCMRARRRGTERNTSHIHILSAVLDQDSVLRAAVSFSDHRIGETVCSCTLNCVEVEGGVCELRVERL